LAEQTQSDHALSHTGKRHSVSGNRRLGFLLAATTMLAWSTLPVALKITLLQLDPVSVTWFRFAVALAIGGAWLLGSGRILDFRGLGTGTWWLLAFAAVMLTVNYVLFLFGLDRVSPGNAQIIMQLAPLLLALSGIVLFGERYSPGQWAGFVTLVLGLSLFFSDQVQSFTEQLDNYLAGVGLVALAAFVWVAYGIAQKQLLRDMGSQTILVFIYLVATILLFPATSLPSFGDLTTAGWLALIFCAINTLVAYGALAEAMDHWEASRVGAVLALIPLGAMGCTTLAAKIWPHWIHNEDIGMMGWIGAFLVVAGSMSTSLLGQKIGGHRTRPRRAGQNLPD
jgi:drug/metabolite transporter (DMT)-like permease